MDALHSAELDVRRRGRTRDQRHRPTLARDEAADDRDRLGHEFDDLGSASTTQMCRSGMSVSARRPSRAPEVSTIVPVSAIATVQPVTTPSSGSSSTAVIASLRQPGTAGRHEAGTPAGTAIRLTPCAAQTLRSRRDGPTLRGAARRRGSRRHVRRTATTLLGVEHADSAVGPRRRLGRRVRGISATRPRYG